MTPDKSQRVLERFNEKVEKLERLQFLREPPQIGAIVTWERNVGWDGVHVGPKEQAVDSTVLTLRFFLQKNEPTSLMMMAEMYPTLAVSSALVKEFLSLRLDLNEYLDAPSNLWISEDRPMSHREILEMFLWGELSHANEKLERQYQEVSKTALFPLFQADFVVTVRNFVMTLCMMSNVNAQALEELKSGS